MYIFLAFLEVEASIAFHIHPILAVYHIHLFMPGTIH